MNINLFFLAPIFITSLVFLNGANASSVAQPLPFVLDMVHDNPGEPPQPTAFRDPQKLSAWVYNGQIIEAQSDSCETFDAIASDRFAQRQPRAN